MVQSRILDAESMVNYWAANGLRVDDQSVDHRLVGQSVVNIAASGSPPISTAWWLHHEIIGST